MYCFLVAALCVGTRGVELGVKVGLITQGPNEGGGPQKSWNKNVVFILFFFYF